MKNKFKIQAKVWRWPGDAGWHFVNVETKISKKIRDAYPKGFVRVEAKVGDTHWETALFPHKQSGAYLLSIKKPVRKKEDIWEGDVVMVHFEIK